jgi:hypothetical protein
MAWPFSVSAGCSMVRPFDSEVPPFRSTPFWENGMSTPRLRICSMARPFRSIPNMKRALPFPDSAVRSMVPPFPYGPASSLHPLRFRSGSSGCQPASSASLRLSLNRALSCPSRDAVLLPRLSVLPAYASLVTYTFSLSHPPLAVVSSSAQRTLFAFTFDIFVGVCRFRDCTSHQMTKPTAHTSRPCSFMG